jgi:hypothetical protein
MQVYQVQLLDSVGNVVLQTNVYAKDVLDAERKADTLVETARDKSVVHYKVFYGQETLEEVRKVERTELFNSIHSVVKKIPRKNVEGDAMDATSCAYELEQLFYKWQQERSYSEEQLRNILLDINLVNPSHLRMTSDGHGEFPDTYKLTQKGIDYIIEQFKKK